MRDKSVGLLKVDTTFIFPYFLSVGVPQILLLLFMISNMLMTTITLDKESQLFFFCPLMRC